MNVDGSGQVNLTNNSADDLAPSFSPDGSKIAFTSYRDGDNEIYIMNADGQGGQTLQITQQMTGCLPFHLTGLKLLLRLIVMETMKSI